MDIELWRDLFCAKHAEFAPRSREIGLGPIRAWATLPAQRDPASHAAFASSGLSATRHWAVRRRQKVKLACAELKACRLPEFYTPMHIARGEDDPIGTERNRGQAQP
jgi:hypothetical protein